MICRACRCLLAPRAQVLPLLAPFLGRGRVGNFLVRNKWRSYESIQRCKHLPILLLSSLQARAQRSSICRGCMAKRHELVAHIFTCSDICQAWHRTLSCLKRSCRLQSTVRMQVMRKCMRTCPSKGLRHCWRSFRRMRCCRLCTCGSCTRRWAAQPAPPAAGWSSRRSVPQHHFDGTCCAFEAQHCSAIRLPLLHAMTVWSGIMRRSSRHLLKFLHALERITLDVGF